MTDSPEAPEPITKPNAEAALAAHGSNPWAIRGFRLIGLGRLSAGSDRPVSISASSGWPGSSRSWP